jgi:hypothetical protein
MAKQRMKEVLDLQPFEAGENGRIAFKIVDDRGIESLKVMDLG